MPRRLRALTALVAVGLLASGLGAAPAAAEDTATRPVLTAKAWLVADLSTGAVLAWKSPHRRLPPASTLKTLTAVTLLPVLDPDAEYRVQWEDAAAEGSAVGIVPDATYTVDQLFYGLMLPSGNDAAHALANAAGGLRSTVARMQSEADRIGALDTTVRNPSGLDAPGQLTSAYDLALIAREGLRRDDFRRYVSTVTVPFPAEMPARPGRERQTYQIYNQNPLLYDGYRGAIGVKTGYTTQAGRTFVGAAERRGHLLVVTMLGYVEATETAATRLLDWGFAHLDAEPVGYLVGAPRPEERVVARTGVALPPARAATAGPSLPLGWGRLAGGAVLLLGLAAMVGGLGARRRARAQGSSGSSADIRS